MTNDTTVQHVAEETMSLLDADRLDADDTETEGGRIFAAGRLLLEELALGRELGRHAIRKAMTETCGEENDAWSWKTAYEAVEAAVVLFLGRYGRALLEQGRKDARGRTEGAARMLESLLAVERLEPPQTQRTLEQVRLQQFSTPLPIAWCLVTAADVRPDDIVLEPSAGTGTLAAMAAWNLKATEGGRLILNEIADTRRELLGKLFPQTRVRQVDGEHIANEVRDVEPTVVVMNPPFSRGASVRKMRRNMDTAHVASAYRTLAPGGRLAAVTSEGCIPKEPEWASAFRSVRPPPTVLASERLSGRLYRKHGTNANCRLTVLEKPQAAARDAEIGTRIWSDTNELLVKLLRDLPGRRNPTRRAQAGGPRPPSARKTLEGRRRRRWEPAQTHSWGPVGEIKYRYAKRDHAARVEEGDEKRPYADWDARTLLVEEAGEHPTALVESRAMAAILPPLPKYQPYLPLRITEEGLLSNAQVESVVLAGEAMQRFLNAEYMVSTDWVHTRRTDGKKVRRSDDDEIPHDVRWQPKPVRYRVGWMLGDGTGTGKGRQVAGMLIDQWLRGRRRSLWLSQSDKLIEDARRDWTALGGHGSDILSVNKFKLGERIPLTQGVLFATYATLRTPARQDKVSRLEQIVDWLAGSTAPADCNGFEGCIIFDESHAMAKAAGGKGSRGRVPPSQQGLAGLRLQNALPSARVVYVSATGASTVAGLAYAKRLGLWDCGNMPFERRQDFVNAMTDGGVAAMEVVARDLKALGLYQARALSYTGVEIETLQHELTEEQIAIYNEYARAFLVIHQNIDKALEETGIETEDGCQDPAAKGAARSAFEGAKQSFFGHLLTSMKMPTVLAAIREDLEHDRAPIVQIVSTGEALMERRLADIPTSEWQDLSIDLTPREYVLDYLRRAFPTQAYVEVEDNEGNTQMVPKYDENGDRVECREAVQRRDALIERLALLPPVQGALDQLVQALGHENVAEITGRSQRIVRIVDPNGNARMALESRPDSANLSEAEAFMSGRKGVLVFSRAGGIGRSYHADLDCGNQKRRYHYVVDAGWQADNAIQGLGRSHRTHQRSAPRFRPVTTNVRAERRFISTIARRLDALGAITRGQRNSQTAMGDDESQSLYHASDNFESEYARKALRQFYWALLLGKIPGQSLSAFEERTGLDLQGAFVEEKRELPPMHTFLNRMLALEVEDQNTLFAEIETRLETNIEDAIEAGTFNQGVETVRAESLRVVQDQQLYQDSESGAETRLVELIRRRKVRLWSLDDAKGVQAHEEGLDRPTELLVNEQSGHAAVQTRAGSWVDEETGAVTERARLYRPGGTATITLAKLATSRWQQAPVQKWQMAWEQELKTADRYREDRVWLATGLLLPIWDRLPGSNVKVWRLMTDDGQNLIGRLLNLTDVQNVVEALGSGASVKVSMDEIFNEVRRGATILRLTGGGELSVVGRIVMGHPRVELRGATREVAGWLKRQGCRIDVIGHTPRVTVPNADTLGAIVERYPIAA